MAYRNKRKLSNEELKYLSDLANSIPPYYLVDENFNPILRTVHKKASIRSFFKQLGQPIPDKYAAENPSNRYLFTYEEQVIVNPYPDLLNAYCKGGPNKLKEVYNRYLQEELKIREHLLKLQEEQASNKDNKNSENNEKELCNDPSGLKAGAN